MSNIKIVPGKIVTNKVPAGWIAADRIALDARGAASLAASLRRTRLALLGLAVLAAAVVATAAWLAREKGFAAGVTAAEEQIEATVVEAYRQGQRDAQETAYTCRGVAI